MLFGSFPLPEDKGTDTDRVYVTMLRALASLSVEMQYIVVLSILAITACALIYMVRFDRGRRNSIPNE